MIRFDNFCLSDLEFANLPKNHYFCGVIYARA